MLHSQLQATGARRILWASPPMKRLLGHSCPQLPTWQSWRQLLQQVRLRQHQDLKGNCTLAKGESWAYVADVSCFPRLQAAHSCNLAELEAASTSGGAGINILSSMRTSVCMLTTFESQDSLHMRQIHMRRILASTS